MAAVALAIALLWPMNAAPTFAQDRDAGDGSEVRAMHVQGRVYVLVGAGANITVQVGEKAIVLVDVGSAQMSDQVISAIKALSPKPIEFIVDTSADEDHIGGNQDLAKTGHFVTGLAGEDTEASVISTEALMDRVSARTADGKSAIAQDLWPSDTYDGDKWQLFNDEAIILEHPHAAHTDGDSIVFFRRSDVVSTGDIFTPNLYPRIELEKGGTIQGEIDALNQLLDIMVPEESEEGGTYVIPGHGRVCDRTEVANYRDMVTIVRDRIRDFVKKGKTLDEVKAAKPTLDYDGTYGADTGAWTTNDFIAAVYNDLSRQKGASGSGRAEDGETR